MTERRSEMNEFSLRQAMMERLNAGGQVTFGALRQSLAKQFFGRVKESAYARNVKVLAKEGKLSRTKSWVHAPLDDNERLTASAPDETIGDPEGVRSAQSQGL